MLSDFSSDTASDGLLKMRGGKMIKKVVMGMMGAMLAGFLFFASTQDVNAALYCTYDTINAANADIASATAGYEAAKADEAAKFAAFNAIKANPAHSQLEYEQAAYAYNNAKNVSRWWLTKVNNANAYLKNIKSREAFEDKFAANRAALSDLTKLQAAKTDADSAASIANGAAVQVANVEKALAGYQSQVAAIPSYQAQVDALTAQLAALKADYAAKAAVAAEKANLFNTYLKTLNYGSYSLGFEHYQHDREWQRDNEDWKPVGYTW